MELQLNSREAAAHPFWHRNSTMKLSQSMTSLQMGRLGTNSAKFRVRPKELTVGGNA